MLAGYDRYMQIARCFRDEDLRADRQPEFTQIDLEMAFVDIEEVIAVNEAFLQLLFREIKQVEMQLPLPRLTYAEAMRRYGSDKPDLRFGMELCDITTLVGDNEFKPFAAAAEWGQHPADLRAGRRDNEPQGNRQPRRVCQDVSSPRFGLADR